MKYGAGGKVPSGAKASDSGGERHVKLRNGVGMGKEDSLMGRHAGKAGAHEGKVGEFNEGRKEEICYHHARKAYRGE